MSQINALKTFQKGILSDSFEFQKRKEDFLRVLKWSQKALLVHWPIKYSIYGI